MRKLLSIVMASAVIICSFALLAGCEKTSDMIDTPADGSTGQSEAAGPYIAPGSDILPESMIGTWYPEEIYQYAVASDISDEQALGLEQQYCLSVSYSAFSRYTDDISGAVFKVNEQASYDDLISQGIQVDPLIEQYGEYAQITSAAVYDGTGAYCTTLFMIEGKAIVAYGAGMNVFLYERMESVG